MNRVMIGGLFWLSSVVSSQAFDSVKQPHMEVQAARNVAFDTIRRLMLQQSSSDGICELGNILSRAHNAEVVFYLFSLAGCSGGNHSEQYLMQIVRINHVWQALIPLEQVGTRGDFFVQDFEVNNRGVLLYGKEYTKNDALCCPSKDAAKIIVFSDH